MPPKAAATPPPSARQEVKQLRGELEDLLRSVEGDDEFLAPAPAPGVVDAAIFDSGDHDRESLAREALRRALTQEQDTHRRTKAFVDGLRLEAEEARAHAQVALATERAETIRLRSLVRKLGTAAAGPTVVEDYEACLEKLRKRNMRLQRRNVQLELARRSSATTKPTPLLSVAKRQAKTITRLEAENDLLKKKNRKLPLALRIARSQTSVASRRSNEVEDRDKLLADERARVGALGARNDLLHAELRLCRSDQRNLTRDRAALVAKLGQLRDFVAALPAARLGDYAKAEPKRGGVAPPPPRNFAAPGPPRPPPFEVPRRV